MNRIPFYFPFGYFVKTRLNTKPAVLFHFYAEFLLGVLLLVFTGLPPLQAVLHFAAGYLAFISFYEIGYLYNDFVSVRYEANPRKRIAAWSPSGATLTAWVLIRVAVFVGVTWLVTGFASLTWAAFYLALGLAFCLHNVLKKKESKILTFVSLAFLRFYAPIYYFMEKEFLVQTMAGVFLFYVLFRTLTYIDSKGLLRMPERNSLGFKWRYYLLLLPLSGLISLLSGSLLTLLLNGYFLLFWGGLLLMDQLRIITIKEIKTE